MDRNGTINTKMMNAKEEIDGFINNLLGKKVQVFLAMGKFSERVYGILKNYDGSRVLVDDVVCFLGAGTSISGDNR